MIYLLEDDANIRKLVCYALSKEGFEVCGFEYPHSFFEKVSEKVPDLAILDIMLPEEDGLSVLSKLRKAPETHTLPVIMLTAKSSEFDIVTGLDAGADDYISKPFGMTELVSRVNALLRRTKGAAARNAYQVGTLFVDPGKHVVKNGAQTVTLSFKEYTLLTTLLEAGGNVLSRDELLSRVWGEYYDESRTLDVHIRKLRIKLGDAGKYIQTVKNIGYKLGVPENDG